MDNRIKEMYLFRTLLQGDSQSGKSVKTGENQAIFERKHNQRIIREFRNLMKNQGYIKEFEFSESWKIRKIGEIF